MNLHILGICGTFMGGLALLARQAGHRVSGSDQNIYPPMSDQLANADIELFNGYRPEHIETDTDLVVIGNALSRGNTAVEYVLNRRIPYTSGPQWLGENILAERSVIAVAGTHGKTTTSSLLAWILAAHGHQPGFLIGGVPSNFGVCAQPGDGAFFVIEADEYDTAFFDKRSKFLHYRPQIAILNNLEYDHADIFPDLAAIQLQFHHLVRTVANNGTLIVNQADQTLAQVLERGCWTPVVHFGGEHADWRAHYLDAQGTQLALTAPDGDTAQGHWSLCGQHNLLNAAAAAAAAHVLGVSVAESVAALSKFQGVKRRLEPLVEVNRILVLDDFAHHPSAIKTTLEGLRRRYRERRILAVIDPRSYSMRSGIHATSLGPALQSADRVIVWGSALQWDPNTLRDDLGAKVHIAASAAGLLSDLQVSVRPGDVVVFMSNGAFDGIPQRFVAGLSSQRPA